MRTAATVGVVLAVMAGGLPADEGALVPVRTKSTLVAPEVAKAPAINGRLDDAAWPQAQPLRHWGSDGKAARARTEAWLCRDAKRLYVAARCHDDRLEGLVTRFEGPELWRNDCLVISIVPDKEAASCTVLTVACDGRLALGKPGPDAPGAPASGTLVAVEVKTGRESGAWTVEVAIPVAVFAAPIRPVSTWALGLGRRKWTEPAEVSTFQGGIDRPAEFPDLTFDDRTIVLDGIGLRNIGARPDGVKVRLRHGEEMSETVWVVGPGETRPIGWRAAPGELKEGDEIAVELVRRGGTMFASETYVMARLSDAAAGAGPGIAVPAREPLTPALDRAPGARFEMGGVVREYLDAITAEWLLKMPEANPAILAMFADRDRKPYRDLLPWSGEFAGKYLTGAVQVLRLTGDEALKASLARFVARLVALQDADGYLGPFPKESRLTGKAPNVDGGTWDVWGHYHIMLGLLLWHEETGDPQALACAAKIGDLLCRTFLGADRRIVDTGEPDKNHAAVHSLCLLYRRTRAPRYLDLAREIVDEFGQAGAGDYVRTALAGKEFFQCPKPRWESLHPIMGLAELYGLTGDADCRKAFEHIWWSIVKLDRHNNGGFSSGEQAQGNPYHQGAIETCCTVAWIAMSVEMLRLTGSPVVADEIELSTLNSVMGYQSRTGQWCTYDTPMNGFRRPTMQDIAFQQRPGSEQVNCCSANAPRGFGMISDWALMADGQGLVVNWYGPSTMAARAGGVAVRLRQRTDYPRDGRIVIEVAPERPARFALRLRVPHWSAATRVAVNGKAVPDVRPGTYLALDRAWAAGDTIEIGLDMSLRFWAGEKECAGKAAVYRGPLLLAYETDAPAIALSPHWRQYGDLWAANAPGATAEYAFEGTGVRWMGRKFDDAGKARVTIDGRDVGVVDQYGPGRGLPFSWEHRGLAPGKHTIRITVLDQKAEASKGLFINVTGFAEPAPEGAPAEGAVVFDARTLEGRLVDPEGRPAPMLLLECTTVDGRKVRLRDFATAGEGGREYVSWLAVRNAEAVPFTRANPSRTAAAARR